jgi:hypothetical protein
MDPMTNPPSEVKCCECKKPRECADCKKGICSSTNDYMKCGLPIHPKESPVSQSVEWEKQVRVLLGTNEREFLFLPSDDGFGVRPMTKKDLRDIVSTTLSTLVKEMEGLMKDISHDGLDAREECDECIGFNAGISAAVEVVKKMV